MNKLCRFELVDWIWSSTEQDHSDRTTELPRPVWGFDRRTPVVFVDFVAFRWTRTFHPTNIGRETQYAEIFRRPLSIVVGDCWPKSCMQLEHNRFLLPSDHLPAEDDYYGRLELCDGEPLDGFSVDSDRIVDTSLGILGGEPETTLGSGTVVLKAEEYCHILEEVHQAGVNGYVKGLPDDDPEGSEEDTEDEEDY